MARIKNTSESTRTIKIDKKTGEKHNIINKNSSVVTYNGDFVSRIFLIFVLFLSIVLITGSIRNEPVDLVVGIANRVSNYGEGFVGDLEDFNDYCKKLEGDDDHVITFYTTTGPIGMSHKTRHDVKIPDWLYGSYNGLVQVVKFLLIIPYAIASLSVRFIVLICSIIGFCIL